MSISDTIRAQRLFFRSGATREVAFRRRMLRALGEGVLRHEQALLAALAADLAKPACEAYGAEIALLLADLAQHVRHAVTWSRPQRVRTPGWLEGSTRIHREPYGTSLIVAPWNYPVLLLLAPLLGAISAGGTAVLKPSERAPASAAALADLIREVFPESYVAIFPGGPEVAAQLLQERYDHIFFTGNATLGKAILAGAAAQLTPVTLELGGKNPCIVDLDADLVTCARRLAWGKFVNAGQTCVAPDYCFVHRQVREPLVQALRQAVERFFGADPERSPDYGRIVDDAHLQRLTGMASCGRVEFGGTCNPASRYLAPTVISRVTVDDPVLMAQEIFGPILPLIDFDDLETVVAYIVEQPKPLAFYYFSRDRAKQESMMARLPAGGGCINDVAVHAANPYAPFGGVGLSGMGSYHGRASFEAFSHAKTLYHGSTRVDLPLRYPPYGQKVAWLRAWTRWVLRLSGVVRGSCRRPDLRPPARP